jgi:hypothetical protein
MGGRSVSCLFFSIALQLTKNPLFPEKPIRFNSAGKIQIHKKSSTFSPVHSVILRSTTVSYHSNPIESIPSIFSRQNVVYPRPATEKLKNPALKQGSGW